MSGGLPSIFVSIHTPTKGVTLFNFLVLLLSQVSIHTPTKGVTIRSNFRCGKVPCFNPHTHEGCDIQRLLKEWREESFNPHTHEGCDVSFVSWQHCPFVSIHTPTKGVTLIDLSQLPDSEVSIHTPTKGVTRIDANILDVVFVSIHTPTKGVTSSPRDSAGLPTGFNPHTHEGCDTCQQCYHDALIVSIHTPTKGVTTVAEVVTALPTSFNPHTHEGCDSCPSISGGSSPAFQSTHPRRV